MSFDKKLKEVQAQLVKADVQGWLLYDFHRCNSIAHDFLEIPADKITSRRFFYWIPERGEPVKIVPRIESSTLDHLPGKTLFYLSWQELEKLLFSLVSNKGRIAMEYSPNHALPNVSKVDAGVVELIRKMEVEIVSSADLLQYQNIWTSEQFQSHLFAAQVLDQIVTQVWTWIEENINKHISFDEYDVQQFMLQKMHANNCHTADYPICAVNAHSADPHYQPIKNNCSTIKRGDFILLDLWCKQKTPKAVYADITRMGVADSQPSEKQRGIFEIVKTARDQATFYIRENYQTGTSIQGWQVDQICRDVIEQSGYGEFFTHRTGHNIGEEVHGAGANIDNLETHDNRHLLPGTCFSIEPGIYLPGQLGVRLEYDVYLNPDGQVHVTGGIQENLMCFKK